MSNVEAGKEPDERTYPATVAEISSPGMIFINRGALHGVLDHGEAAVRRRVRKKSSFQVFSGAEHETETPETAASSGYVEVEDREKPIQR
ncbi:MAG: hypothetical protein ACR2JR_12845 [Rubrobacteraceae bacterium]